jgi:drug/metabolite transporter (DMT)-like permease
VRPSLLPYAAVAFAASAWGTWGLLIRHADAIAPGTPVTLQSTLVMAVITVTTGLAAIVDRVPGRASWRTRAWVTWLGVGDAFNLLLFFAAYKLTIAVSVLTHYLAPVFVAIAAPLVLKERMTPRMALAIGTSFAGLAVMLVPSAGGADARSAWVSAALGAGSAAFYASNVIVNKLVAHEMSASETMFWHGVVATPLLAAFVPPEAWGRVDAHGAMFLGVATIGPGALAGVAFVWGLRRMPAAHASTLTLLEPLVSIALAAAVLGERLGLPTAIGGALILAGSLVVTIQPGAVAAPRSTGPGT